MSGLAYALLGALVALGLVAAAARLRGFASQKPEHYAERTPAFDIRERLQGAILCEGVLYGPLGRVTSRFVADMNARWEGDRGHMTEAFRYDTGTTQDREWTLIVHEGGRIEATAPDIIGTGEGWQKGAAVCLKYRIRLPEQAGGHVLDVTDWMYLIENGTIMNRSEFRKFGIKVAELVATMRPAP
ncbi:MAG: DUF3833 domain-containing protein [Rhodobacteraceae bacterium]|nr:DUF3833 domain-containing protein [Paracoccaceae bacterium]